MKSSTTRALIRHIVTSCFKYWPAHTPDVQHGCVRKRHETSVTDLAWLPTLPTNNVELQHAISCDSKNSSGHQEIAVRKGTCLHSGPCILPSKPGAPSLPYDRSHAGYHQKLRPARTSCRRGKGFWAWFGMIGDTNEALQTYYRLSLQCGFSPPLP